MTIVAAVTVVAALAIGVPCRGPCKLLRSVPKCRSLPRDVFALESMMPPRRRSNRYEAPDPESGRALQRSIRLAFKGKRGAFGAALRAGYVLCAERREGVLLWQPALPGTGGAVLALRAIAARRIIVEVPHPLYDLGTLDEGLHAFEELSARALLASGVHRCAASELSDCDGKTQVCANTPEPYRHSDVAHHQESMFQAAHRALSDAYEEDVILSLHGMSADGIATSDGTLLPTSTTAVVAVVTEALAKSFGGLALVRACNPMEEGDSAAHLCGTTNIQGRYTNGVTADACTTTASVASGRFLHLEQSREVREEYRRVVEVLDDVLPQ